MQYTTLGRTGLRVSVAGLGCGGFSQLGLGTGKSEADAIQIIHAALDLGVNVFETAPHDPEHQMVTRACPDGMWDVVMLGFHMMHQNARQNAFPLTRQYRVGTLMMFAVRNIFSQAGRLQATMRELAADGLVPQAL